MSKKKPLAEFKGWAVTPIKGFDQTPGPHLLFETRESARREWGGSGTIKRVTVTVREVE